MVKHWTQRSPGHNVGKKVRLTGKSRHGKNRVREQGEDWEVVGETDTVHFRTSAPGPFLLLHADIKGRDGHHARWVSIQRDPDFTLEML
jgi:hypothetical protein|tara:strand:+ start:210 stop:476 length:267 start_codon:yes stop_codon:yes gene_type:complete